MHTFIRSCTSLLCAGLFALLVASCKSGGFNSSSYPLQGDFAVPAKYIYLAKTSDNTLIHEQNILTKLLMMLDSGQKDSVQKAAIFYESGLVYDELGLESMARFMMMNAIVSKPDYAAAYELIGVYYLKDGRIADACDAFDSAIELDKNGKSMFPYLNRAYAMYYSKRYQKAYEDICIFYNADKKDPYRLLSKYIIESAYKGEQKAIESLSESYINNDLDIKSPFGIVLINHTLGLITTDELFNKILEDKNKGDLMQEHLCEAYFYLGQKALKSGDDKLAYDYFKLSRATNKYSFLEYRNSYLELRALEKKYNLIAPYSAEEREL